MYNLLEQETKDVKHIATPELQYIDDFITMGINIDSLNMKHVN